MQDGCCLRGVAGGLEWGGGGVGGGRRREENKLEEGHNKWMEGVGGKECMGAGGGSDGVRERAGKAWGGRHEI